MTNFKGYFLCLATLLLSGCREQTVSKVNDAQVVKIDIGNAQDITPSILSMRFLKLTTADGEALIGRVNKIVRHNRYLYIHDAMDSKELFVYDLDGQFKFKLNKRGRGAGEYISIDDFIIDKKNGDIIVLDEDGRKIVTYDKDGEYVSSFSIKYNAPSMILHNDKFILDKGNYPTDGSDNYLSVLDRNGNPEAELFPKRENMDNFNVTPFTTLWEFQDTVRYFPSVSNNVYSIIDSKVEIKYHFDFGSLWPNEDFVNRVKDEKFPLFIGKALTDEGYAVYANYMESKSFVHVYFDCNKEFYMTFMNKYTGVTKTFTDKNKTLGRPYTFIDDEIVMVIDSPNNDDNPALVFVALDI